jgi:hypothetical protein
LALTNKPEKAMQTKQVKNASTLRMLERAGKIKEPPAHVRPKGAKWGGGYSYVDGDAGTFAFKGRKFTVQYVSGCFFPFVWEQFN